MRHTRTHTHSIATNECFTILIFRCRHVHEATRFPYMEKWHSLDHVAPHVRDSCETLARYMQLSPNRIDLINE